MGTKCRRCIESFTAFSTFLVRSQESLKWGMFGETDMYLDLAKTGIEDLEERKCITPDLANEFKGKIDEAKKAEYGLKWLKVNEIIKIADGPIKQIVETCQKGE
jgi:hypothetical protein